MRRKITIVAHVEDDRDRTGRGSDSLIGIEERLTSDVATTVSGSRYNLKPIDVQTWITEDVDPTADGRQGSLEL